MNALEVQKAVIDANALRLSGRPDQYLFLDRTLLVEAFSVILSDSWVYPAYCYLLLVCVMVAHTETSGTSCVLGLRNVHLHIRRFFFLCSLHVHPCMHKHTLASVDAKNEGRLWATGEHCYPRWGTETGEREWTVKCRGTESLGTSIMLDHQVLCSLSGSIKFAFLRFSFVFFEPCLWHKSMGKIHLFQYC